MSVLCGYNGSLRGYVVLSVWCNKIRYIWLDGKIINCEDAKIHVLTHALHYGTAVFEGIRGYMGVDNLYVFRLTDHMARLLNSAKIIGLELAYSIEDLVNATLEVIRANNYKEDIYIRPIVFVGEGSLSLNIANLPVRVAIAAFPFGHYLKPSGIKAKIASWRRVPSVSMPIMAKASGIYLNSVISLSEALRLGFDEAILLDIRGYISEGSGENIFIVRKGEVSTPPITASILEGITRDSVIRIARDLDLKVYERDIIREEIYTADEVFLTGTAAEITPVVFVDNHVIGSGEPGPITLKLQKAYDKIVRGLDEKYKHWLTAVY